jgi:hypothetical protein
MKADITRFISSYVKELEEGTAAVFVGAGLSIPAGHVDWKELLRSITKDLGLDVDRESDLVTLAQFHLNKNRDNRSELTQIVNDEFNKNTDITENHKILSRLPIETFWTTNYDDLIERSLREASKIPDTKFTIAHLSQSIRNRDAVVYKMHGDITHAHEVILTRDDYEAYHLNFGAYITALSGDLVAKTFLFIGFSFTDPNLEHVLSRIRTTFETNQRKHFCIMKSVEQNVDEDESSFEYRKRRHKLVVADLLNYNIHVLEIDDYTEVTEILSEIEKKYRQRTIFISGSAHEYGDWGYEKATEFIVDLGRELVRANFKVVTGMGLGVGNFVISGALDQIYMNQNNILRDELVMRPFPQQHQDKSQLHELWEAYRQDMTNYAGISLFLFGNKLDGDDVVVANGMLREFEIAKDKGHVLIPIGATGYAAKSLWEQVFNNFEDFFPDTNETVKKEFESLGDKAAAPDLLIANVITILNKLNH